MPSRPANGPAGGPGGPAPVAGQAGLALAHALGIGEDDAVAVVGAPDGFADRLAAALGDRNEVSTDLSQAALYDVIVAFMTWRTEMEDMLGLLRPKMAPACKLWILWPAADPRVAGDLTDQAIREVASSGGLAATGARPIDQTWSAMRLTIRRPASAGG